MKEKSITKKDKIKITNDWLYIFNDFSQFKPMHLVKRNGPFLLGIYLQTYTSNTDYEPVFHLHNLMIEFPAITLGASKFLLNKRNTRDSVTLDRHQFELNNIAKELREQCSLLQKNNLLLNDLVAYLDESVKEANNYPFDSLRDEILALIWCGKQKEADNKLLKAIDLISKWPKGVKDRFGGEAGWKNQMHEMMSYNNLEQSVKKELFSHKLDNLIDYKFICS